MYLLMRYDQYTSLYENSGVDSGFVLERGLKIFSLLFILNVGKYLVLDTLLEAAFFILPVLFFISSSVISI